MNINDLMAAIADASKGASINLTVNVMNTDGDVVVPAAPVAPALPDTDFEVGDEVLVCHIKKDGSGTKHTKGTVIEVQQQDDKGWYTRVLGDNGKHYRTGLHINEERLGSKIIYMFDEYGDLID